MKMVEIVNGDSGHGFKLVVVALTIENVEIEVEYFVHTDGRIEPHKNTAYNMCEFVTALISQNASNLFLFVKEAKEARILELEKELKTLKGEK